MADSWSDDWGDNYPKIPEYPEMPDPIPNPMPYPDISTTGSSSEEKKICMGCGKSISSPTSPPFPIQLENGSLCTSCMMKIIEQIIVNPKGHRDLVNLLSDDRCPRCFKHFNACDCKATKAAKKIEG